MQRTCRTERVEMIKDTIYVLPKDTKFKKPLNREASAERLQALAVRRDSVHSRSFKRAPPSLWLGYTYQFHPVSEKLRLTVRLTGLLPESLQNRKSTNIHVKIRLRTPQSDKKSDICIVRHGQQLKASTLIFDDMTLDILRSAELVFAVYFQKGRIFKTAEPIMKWVVCIETQKVLRSVCDWKNINNLA